MLFDSLVWPLQQMPGLLSKFSEARTSLMRVNKFLRRKDVKNVDELLDGDDTLISAKDGEFEWEAEEDLDDDGEEANSKKKKKKGEKGDEKVEEGSTVLNVIGGNGVLMMEDFVDEEADVDGEEEPKNGDSEEKNGHDSNTKEGEKDPSSPCFLLKDLNFQIKEGELVAVIGHVGSGI